MTTEPSEPQRFAESARPPEAIIADYLAMFGGGDDPPGHWTPAAEMLLRWLADEGYVVVRAVNVKDHGAAGDGVTDDTAALQAAIDAAAEPPHFDGSVAP